MIKVCKKVGLKNAKIMEESTGLIKEIAGSPEIKGIRGTDKRKYVIDLLRVHPRDSNFQNIKEHSVCLVREELIKIYNLSQNNPKISLKTLSKLEF